MRYDCGSAARPENVKTLCYLCQTEFREAGYDTEKIPGTEGMGTCQLCRGRRPVEEIRIKKRR